MPTQDSIFKAISVRCAVTILQQGFSINEFSMFDVQMRGGRILKGLCSSSSK
jgi:hypothetical protein